MEIFQSHRNEDEGSFGGLTPKASFIAGIIAGVLALCTIGFFILLNLMLSGKDLSSLGKTLGVAAGAGKPPTAAQPTATPPSDQGDPVGEVKPVSDRDHVQGPKNAAVTLIEYSDLECPFCKRFHPTMLQLMKEYEGKVRWVYRHFPLSFHQNAQKESEASECVAELGGNDKFWKFIDTIYERTTSNGTGFALDKLSPLAVEVGVDKAKFETCFNSGRYTDYVTQDLNSGIAAGVTGTPGTIVTNTKGQSQIVPGAVDYSELKSLVDALLAK